MEVLYRGEQIVGANFKRQDTKEDYKLVDTCGEADSSDVRPNNEWSDNEWSDNGIEMKFLIPLNEGRSVLRNFDWIRPAAIEDPPDDCQLAVFVVWLPGYDFKWLGTQINEFAQNETNQIALYFDGQFSIEGIALPIVWSDVRDQSSGLLTLGGSIPLASIPISGERSMLYHLSSFDY